MFENLNFWKQWPGKQRGSFFALIGLLLIAFCFLLIGYYSDGAFVIDWKRDVTTKPIRIVYDEFSSGLYDFLIYADNYVLNEFFRSGDLTVNEPIAYVYLGIFVTGIIFLFALATTLSRFYFYLSAGFLLLILLTFNFENLLVFGLFGKEVLVAVFLLLALTGYYFHAFRAEVSFSVRFFVLLGIAALIAIIIHFFAEAGSPFYYLAAYGVVSSMIISVVFILMVAFEIVKAILIITTKSSGGNGRNNFTHFTIIMMVYLAVLILMFLYNEDYIGWRLIFINPVWLLAIATVTGIWGFKNKEETYSQILPFRPFGAYAYLTGAIICFTSTGFFMASANDPYVDIIEDAVIFSQIAFTIIFYVYIVANFFPAMMEGMKVYKILYKPKFMPLFSARFAGLIGVLAFVVLIKMLPYYQAFAGYYISIAKLHMVLDDRIIAKEYFDLANIYGRQTHLGNLALAKMAEKQNDLSNKSNYLAKSINQNPTEYAYADLALLFSGQDRYFDAFFTLKKGLNDFPDSGPLNNNMGLLLTNSKILDSAAMFLERSATKSVSQEAAETNLYSIFALYDLRVSKDSLQMMLDDYESTPVLSNILATAQRLNVNDLKLDKAPVYNETTNIEQLVYNFNYTLYRYRDVDSAQWKDFRDFYADTDFSVLQQNIEYAFGLAFAKKNYSIPAFRIFNVLNQSDIYGYSKYDILLAQLYMKYGAPHAALDHFDATTGYYQNEILIQRAFALMEAGLLLEAQEFWERIVAMEEPSTRPLAQEMLTLLNMESYKATLDQEDQVKYNFLKYRGDEVSFEEHEGLVLSMQNEYYKSKAYVDLADRLYENGNLDEALRVINKINLSLQEDERIVKNSLMLKSQLLAEKDDIGMIREQLGTMEKYKQELRPYHLLMQAFLKKWEGNYDEADRLYSELGYMDAFCETCILKSSEYFDLQKHDPMKAYDILLSAVRINKYSYALNKAYAREAIEMGLDSYANDVLKKLVKVLPEEKYQELELFVEETISENEPEW